MVDRKACRHLNVVTTLGNMRKLMLVSCVLAALGCSTTKEVATPPPPAAQPVVVTPPAQPSTVVVPETPPAKVIVVPSN